MKQRRKRMAKRMRDEIITVEKQLKTECQECFKSHKICTLNHTEYDCQEEDCDGCQFLNGNCQQSAFCPGSLDAILIARQRVKGEKWMTV